MSNGLKKFKLGYLYLESVMKPIKHLLVLAAAVAATFAHTQVTAQTFPGSKPVTYGFADFQIQATRVRCRLNL